MRKQSEPVSAEDPNHFVCWSCVEDDGSIFAVKKLRQQLETVISMCRINTPGGSAEGPYDFSIKLNVTWNRAEKTNDGMAAPQEPAA